MANYNGGGSAICPFYEHESQYAITCEGLVCGAATQLKSGSAAEKTAFVADSCSSFDYRRLCPLAGLLTARYEEEADGSGGPPQARTPPEPPSREAGFRSRARPGQWNAAPAKTKSPSQRAR